MTQWAKYLPGKCKVPGQISGFCVKHGMVAHICNPSTKSV